MRRKLLNTANFIVNLVVLICLLLCGLYAGFALWDNSRIYAAAENVQADMLKLKPKTEDAQGGPSFAELLAVNPDVRGWVTLDNTGVDYPILQGETNLSYINTDVYGNFALAGSIFLDSRNDPAFADAYSLLYGHHMENSQMFGDLDLYKDEAFFRDNRTGALLLPDRSYRLDLFACLLIPASEDAVFEPGKWEKKLEGLLKFTEESAMYLRPEVLEQLRSEQAPQVLALSTCSSEFTDARTIVLAKMIPE